MKLTNKHGLPQAIVNAIKNDPYTPGKRADISVTRLIDAPQVSVLYRNHYKDIVEDVSNRIFSIMGQAMHHILERAEDNDA